MSIDIFRPTFGAPVNIDLNSFYVESSTILFSELNSDLSLKIQE